MSLLLKFSSTIVSRFRKEVTLDEITFQRSTSVEILPPGVVSIVDVTEGIYEDFRNGEYHFKGSLSLPNESSPCEVVIKIVTGRYQAGYSKALQSFTQEAKFYQDHLCDNKSFYGNGVPKIYGCYETKVPLTMVTRDRLVDCACIVFQYCGSGKNLAAWSTGTGISDFGLKAIKLLFEMHKSGISNNSISIIPDRNITCLDGNPFFTDFSQACIHSCPEKEFELPDRLFDLDGDTLKCGELQDFYEALQSKVAPIRFHWYGYDMNYNQVESLESIFQHKRRPYRDAGVSIEDQWERAVKAWKFLVANWASYRKEAVPEVGDTSFEAYRARGGNLDISYSDDEYEFYEIEDEE